MIKKSFGYILLMMILMLAKPSFSMHRLIFRGAKLVGKGTLPLLGGALSYYQAKSYKKFSDDMDKAGNDYAAIANAINNQPFSLFGGLKVSGEQPPSKVEQFLKKRMEKCDDSSSRLSIVMAPLGDNAAALGKKTVVIDIDGAKNLNRALQGVVDDSDKIIAEEAMKIGHEFGHVVNNDIQNNFYAIGLIPLVVEATGTGISHAFNKKWGIKLPSTYFKLACRSFIAVGSIAPKLGFSFVGLALYRRYHEVCADRFACEHAETRKELVAFYDHFKRHQHKFDERYQFIGNTNEFIKRNILRLNALKEHPVHPYFGDRADMVQKYIDKWDAEHKEA